MDCINGLPTYSRYEVRLLCLEELYMMGYEEAMHYTPCADLREAVEKYKDMVNDYDDDNHEVSLCGVTYGAGGYESVVTLASTNRPDKFTLSVPMSEVC